MHAVVLVNRWNRAPATTLDLSLYRQACWEERALDISYHDANGAASRRHIWPLSTVYSEKMVILLAWCTLRRDFRKFIVSRVEAATLSDESFRPRRAGLLRDYLDRLRAS